MEEVWAFFSGLVVGFLAILVILLTLVSTRTVPVKSVVDRGYGLYCPEDGEFAFVGECSNE